MSTDLYRRRARTLGWLLFGLGALIGLDALYMHLTHYEDGAKHVLVRMFGVKTEFTRAQDLMGFAIAFGVAAMISMIASFRKLSTTSTASGDGA